MKDAPHSIWLAGWLFISINFRMKSIGRIDWLSWLHASIHCVVAVNFHWISFVAAVETDFNPVKKIYGEFFSLFQSDRKKM